MIDTRDSERGFPFLFKFSRARIKIGGKKRGRRCFFFLCSPEAAIFRNLDARDHRAIDFFLDVTKTLM